MDDWKEDQRHPAWGKVNISRTSGLTHLFRSSLTHHNYITMTISRAKVVDTSGAADFVMEDGQLIKVAMSETQFARMISSLNMGEGSPCTLRRVNNERQPECAPEDRKTFVQEAHDEHLDKNDDGLKDLLTELQEMRDEKKRPTLKQLDGLIHKLAVASGNFEPNQRYYRERFQEDMEQIVEEAKTEIETHIVNAVTKAGIEHLKDQMPTLVESKPMIEDSS